MAIHKVVREQRSYWITYDELVVKLPYIPQGDYPAEHLFNLEVIHSLIWTQDYFNQDGSKEMLIYIRLINYFEDKKFPHQSGS